jgi:nucleoside-diphosphate-sugar epimerase
VRCFLTGATGFVGSHLTAGLVAEGHEVHALVRSPAAAGALRALGVTLHEGDVTDKASIRRAMEGAERVFHVAGWYKIGLRDTRDAVPVNVDGTRNVLEVMRDLGVPKGIYTSTLAVNSDTHGRVVDETYRFTGEHLSVYDATKAAAHQIAESLIATGLPLVIVQPGAVYGPGDASALHSTFAHFLQRKLPLIPRGTAFAWGHVEDIARGHILAMERGEPGRNYFICGPVHTLEAAVDLASDITGIPGPRIRLNPTVVRVASRLVSPFDRLLPLPPAYTAEGLRVVGGTTYIGTNERARRELGWTVRPLREGLTETLRHEMRVLGMRPNF